jgi:hypothetical protein
MWQGLVLVIAVVPERGGEGEEIITWGVAGPIIVTKDTLQSWMDGRMSEFCTSETK